MNNLIIKKPIFHAVLWILIYVVTVNMGEALYETTGFAYWTALLLAGLSGIMILYLQKNNILLSLGFEKLNKLLLRKCLFYLPLILLALIQFIAGINQTYVLNDFLWASLLMIGVGFLEEVLFRGFLFEGIRCKSGMRKAIIISGVTFGLGHIVNLSRGYGYIELGSQVVVAIAIGLVLALLYAITKNLLPGILFHIIFNISGTITNQNITLQFYLLGIILVIALSYLFFLTRQSFVDETVSNPVKTL